MNLADRDYDREDAKKRWRAAMGIRRPSRGRRAITIIVLVLIGGCVIAQPDLERMLAELVGYLASLG
ncbi:hypothetical protein [Asaia krungthepensis]|uniref:Uncharacterized protein n=1 Tax=Asaia krungthepensis NRIC 0535 TaxID=1307925 RepID=A0ABQ0Q4J9_9PROT|nr:hypothetical protein [Asaia krungthepensis]GBQ91124.1 hypothetical protein AA0535_2213 [Asaia krungthepensis NRIC 0535]